MEKPSNYEEKGSVTRISPGKLMTRVCKFPVGSFFKVNPLGETSIN